MFTEILENGRNTSTAIDARINQEAEFVDQASLQKTAVDDAATLQHDFPEAELSQCFQCLVEIIAVPSCKKI